MTPPKRKATATKRAKVRPPEPEDLVTGLYNLARLFEIIRTVVKKEQHARITLPRTWCQANQVPLLSPTALKLIDLVATSDDHFPSEGRFVLEIGRKQFKWPKVK